MSSPYTIDAVFLTSTIIIFALEGFLAGQTSLYYANHPKDPLITKIWVLLVNLVQFLHNSLCGYISWSSLVASFDPNSHPAPIRESIFAMLSALESFAGFFTTSWFGLRLWFLLGPRWRWIAVPALASSSFVLAMGLLLAEQDGKPVSKEIHSYVATNQRNFHIPWIAGNILADLLVALPMVLKLRATRSGFKQTDSIIKSLSTYIVGTSLLTSGFAIAGLVTLIALPSSPIWIALIRIMSSIYSNTLLTFLNRRRAWNDQSQDSESGLHWSSNVASNGVEKKREIGASRPSRTGKNTPSYHVNRIQTPRDDQETSITSAAPNGGRLPRLLLR